MKKTFLCLLVLSMLMTTSAFGAAKKDVDQSAPTFYEDVLPVLQESCQTCHRPEGANLGGMVAPMSFTDYNETRPWAKSIAKQVEARTMPPWHASADLHGVFENERTITDAEIAAIVAWAKAGAPEGDINNAPAPRVWADTGGWSIGKPDLVIDMGVDYKVEDDIEDHYITFVSEITEEMLPEPRWLKAFEFRPGSSVVHHIIAQPLGGIAPGNDPQVYDEGYGRLLKPGTKVRWQMHYHKEPGPGTAVMDRSFAALQFYPEGYEPEHVVQVDPLATMSFKIPAGDPNYSATTTTKFERDSVLIAYTPHMHVRGKAAHYVAKYPDGTEEVLLDVPRYDFNWQTDYKYPAGGKKVPAGTEIELTMTWDNSPENPSNPDPTIDVVFGEPTTSEMMFGFVTYADAEPGYRPPEGAGFFGGGGRRNIDPERMKKMLKERFGLDWDTMTEEERKEIMQRFRGGQQQQGGDTAPSASGQ
jgi:mono/diheme cytochrome c family protein